MALTSRECLAPRTAFLLFTSPWSDAAKARTLWLYFRLCLPLGHNQINLVKLRRKTEAQGGALEFLGHKANQPWALALPPHFPPPHGF